MAGQTRGREWNYFPGEDGEPFIDKDGNEVLGWHDRTEDLRPILVRDATEVECRINGWEEGTFVRCTTRAKHSYPMWQIEATPTQQEPN